MLFRSKTTDFETEGSLLKKLLLATPEAGEQSHLLESSKSGGSLGAVVVSAEATSKLRKEMDELEDYISRS